MPRVVVGHYPDRVYYDLDTSQLDTEPTRLLGEARRKDALRRTMSLFDDGSSQFKGDLFKHLSSVEDGRDLFYDEDGRVFDRDDDGGLIERID